ncbi:MAG: TIGR03808 family TAT-translocated repetitive protein [Pseudomonadota bacterium]
MVVALTVGMSNNHSLPRRGFLAGAASLAGLGAATTAQAKAALPSDFIFSDLRGSLNASTIGVRPGVLDNQSALFQEAVDAAATHGQPLFLEAGDYLVSNIDLRSGVTIVGVPGRTRIRYAGDGHLFFASGVTDVRLQGLVIDGANRLLADYAPAIIHISTGANIAIEDCSILGSIKDGIVLDRVSGRVERTTISGARSAALVSNEAEGLAIRNNVVADCADNGILVHRWQNGRDGTLVTGNRISRIRAASGGTGPFGNAINFFRADDVIATGNIIDDCDFSAIRCNACSNVQVSNNTCTNLGEVAVFVEFSFQGAVVSNNIVDGAARGISVTNFNDGGRLGVVQGNLIRNLVSAARLPTDDPVQGIGIGVEADTTVIGNVVEDATYAGITVGWGPYLRNVIASQNIVRRAPMGVAVSVVDGVGQAVVSDNMFSGTPDGAVVGMRWLDRATGDLTQTRDVPAPLTVERNRSLGV